MLAFILISNPTSALANPVATATAYCLKGRVTWSWQKGNKQYRPTTSEVARSKGGCIALSRKLAKDLGLKKGPGQFDYYFGSIIEIKDVGQFCFADLMPTKWKGYRADIWFPTLKQCHVFGLKRCDVRLIRKGAK